MKLGELLHEPLPRRLLAMLIVVALGCGGEPSFRAVRAKYEAAARPKLDKLDSVLDHCRDLPPLEEDVLPDVEGVVFYQADDLPEGTAGVLMLAAHDEPQSLVSDEEGSFAWATGWWRTSRRALSDPAPDYEGSELDSVTEYLDQLSKTEFVLVVKTLELVPPMHGDEGRFTLGAFEGEAHLYRLDDAEHLGAFRFVAFGEPVGAAGIDFRISEDAPPEENVERLRGALVADVQDAAEAWAAELHDGIESSYVVENPGGGLANRDNWLLAPRIRRRDTETVE